jgi:hypothetical protein
VTDKNWVAVSPALYNGRYRRILVDNYVHVHRLGVKATYANVGSASLGTDWSISAWDSWKTCSSQISRHHK